MKNKNNFLKTSNKLISKEQIISDLKKLGLKTGDHVAVTLSLKKIGFIKGGPEEFINALIEIIGENGTLMMNSYTFIFPISEVPKDHVFDCKETSAYTGIVPNTFRKRKNAIRSNHPSCSVVALGKYAEFLTKNHSQSSDPFIPYSRLAKIGGKYLCIGLGDQLVAIRHEAQYQAGLSKIVPIHRGVKYKTDKNTEKIFITNIYACVSNLPKLIPHLKEKKILKSDKVGFAQAYIASAGELIESTVEQLKENPELNLCNKSLCLWCRELERRLNLYNRLKNPKIFQSNKLIIQSLFLLNKIRLNRYNFFGSINNKKKSILFLKNWKMRFLFEVINSVYLTIRLKFV